MFNIKCGEIFCQSFENYAIVCVDCDLKTNTYSEFISHYQKIHCTLQPLIKQEVAEAIAAVHFQVEDEIDEDEISNSDEATQFEDTIQENPLENSEIEDKTKIACPYCPAKSYSSRKGLDRHIRAKHDNEAVESSSIAKNAESTCNEKATLENFANETNEIVDLKELVEVKMEQDATTDENNDDDESWSESESKSKFKFGGKTIKKQYNCPECGKKYVNRKSLCVHVRRNHPDLKLPRLNAAPTSKTCPECPDKTFSSLKALYRHRRSKHTPPDLVQNYQCPNCEKQYATREGLSQHLRYVHRVGKVEKQFPCTQCDRVFSERYLLNRHELRHTGQRNVHCDEPNCGLSFYDIKTMNSHKRHVHIGLRKFVCEICGFATKTAACLQIHIRTHTGEKPYKCDQCDKRFATSAAVVEHKVIHNSNIRPHVCDICGKSFSRPKALYHHKPLHSNVKKFVCKICGKAYAQQAGLSAHKRQHALESFGEPT